MKKLLALALLALPMSLNAKGDPTALWQDAASIYQKGEYLRAAEMFQQAVPEDPSGWTAYYNSGNAYFKAGRIPEALEQYWNAFFANPRNGDLLFNMRMALERADDTLAPEGIPTGFYRAWRLIKKEEWITLTLIAWCFFGIAFWRREKMKRWAWASGITTLLFLAASLSHISAENKKWGILRGPGLLRSGPSETLPVTTQIPEGRFIWILEERDGWTFVETRKESLRGWLR